MRRVGSKLSTFIGERRDSEELLNRLVAAGLLAENVNRQRVLAVIQEAFDEEVRAFESRAMLVPGEVRAHMVLDHRLIAFLSPRGMGLMRSEDR